MTEDEAKTKWCPFAKALDPTGKVASNRMDYDFESGANNPDPDCLCLGSGCMAWRWTEIESRNGHCGLAGEP